MPDDDMTMPKDKTGKPIPAEHFDNDTAPADKKPTGPVADWLRDRIDQNKPKR